MLLLSGCYHLNTNIKALLSCSYQLNTSVPMLPSQCHIAKSKEMAHKSILYVLTFSVNLEKRNNYMVRKFPNGRKKKWATIAS